jgi:hydroxyacylglutathione hydrolase
LPLFAGWILKYNRPIIIVKHEAQQLEPILRYLYRLGFDNIGGYLNNIFDWFKKGLSFNRSGFISVEELKNRLSKGRVFLLDVREPKTYSKSGFIKGAYNIYVGHLSERLAELPEDKEICVYFDSGFKTGIALSILLKAGFSRVFGVLGGFSAWVNKGFLIDK